MTIAVTEAVGSGCRRPTRLGIAGVNPLSSGAQPAGALGASHRIMFTIITTCAHADSSRAVSKR
jgi:hypothetical protein